MKLSFFSPALALAFATYVLADGSDVISLTQADFESTVNAESLILVEFFAPWCGHCKKLEPIFEELGEHLKNVENVIVAKLDGTANDVPTDSFKANGFPTIIL